MLPTEKYEEIYLNKRRCPINHKERFSIFNVTNPIDGDRIYARKVHLDAQLNWDVSSQNKRSNEGLSIKTQKGIPYSQLYRFDEEYSTKITIKKW